MRSITIFLGFFLITTLTGCAIPRAVGLHCLALDSAPVMKGDKREEIKVYPWVGVQPSVKAKTTIFSTHSAAEVLEFYRKNLTAKGWIETEESKEQPVPDYDTTMIMSHYIHGIIHVPTPRTYSFERTRICSKEMIEFTIRLPQRPEDPERRVKVEFLIGGDYLWDKPSQFPVWICKELFGPYAMVFVVPTSPCSWILMLL